MKNRVHESGYYEDSDLEVVYEEYVVCDDMRCDSGSYGSLSTAITYLEVTDSPASPDPEPDEIMIKISGSGI